MIEVDQFSQVQGFEITYGALSTDTVRTAVRGVYLSQAAHIRDVLVRFKEYVPVTAEVSARPADPKIRWYKGVSMFVRSYAHTGECKNEDGISGCAVTLPYCNIELLETDNHRYAFCKSERDVWQTVSSKKHMLTKCCVLYGIGKDFGME